MALFSRPCFLIVILSVFLASGARASAINDCIDACFSDASCATKDAQGENVSLCQSARDRCVKQCNDNINGKESVAPRITGAYGAIAFDKATAAWGMADASKNKSAANESALAYCKAQGSACEIVESFSKACAAVASGTGNRVGWAVADNPRQAGLDAIEKCGTLTKGNDHSRCFLQLFNCYFP